MIPYDGGPASVRQELIAYQEFFCKIHPESSPFDVGVCCAYLDRFKLPATIRNLQEAWNDLRR